MAVSIDSTLADSAYLPPPGIPPESLKRFTVDEYHALIDAGAFASDERYELLEGWLVHKMGKKRRHTLATQRLRELLQPLLEGCYVDAQEPVTTDDSEPEPDVVVIRGGREDYAEHQPLAKDVLVVVEVSDRTLARDRGLKKRIYARAGIPVYWLINLVDGQIEVYTEPTGPAEQPGYRCCQIVRAGEELPVAIAGRAVGCLPAGELLR
jgi:Uma2 family endonuclease